ncbi:HNH endonuclease signature motif containing protein [Streptomyces sp. NPDC127051]|uniref:HNH endonuclease signature motif containing protein n=1 Tax=Streptomyces sp. NPDC127051 TaxID=3347119 RepID=UPI003646A4A8
MPIRTRDLDVSLDDMWRFSKKLSDPDENGCIKWDAGGANGYGRFSIKGLSYGAHRVAYTFWIGPVPDGMYLDHVYDLGCRSKLCVNVLHLEPVTHSENELRKWAAVRARRAESRAHPSRALRRPVGLKTGRRAPRG